MQGRITQPQNLYGPAVCVRLAGCAAGCAGWVTLFSAGTAQSTAVRALFRELLQFLLGPHRQLLHADCAASGVENPNVDGVGHTVVPSNMTLASSCVQK